MKPKIHKSPQKNVAILTLFLIFIVLLIIMPIVDGGDNATQLIGLTPYYRIGPF
jgi:cell division protein FtsB